VLFRSGQRETGPDNATEAFSGVLAQQSQPFTESPQSQAQAQGAFVPPGALPQPQPVSALPELQQREEQRQQQQQREQPATSAGEFVGAVEREVPLAYLASPVLTPHEQGFVTEANLDAVQNNRVSAGSYAEVYAPIGGFSAQGYMSGSAVSGFGF
jgi:hypothetical protein